MIGYLKGKITHKNPAFIYIECNGVGYHVNISLNTYSKIEQLNEAQIFTHLQVREDDMSLFGFFDQDERNVFTQLITVSGIGTNTARLILSYKTTEEIRKAIVHEDELSLSKIKGIGPKTAKRIILDLKDKMIKSVDQAILSSNVGNNTREEALSALVALGFQKAVVDKQLNAVMAKNPDVSQVEEVLKLVLRQLS